MSYFDYAREVALEHKVTENTNNMKARVRYAIAMKKAMEIAPEVYDIVDAFGELYDNKIITPAQALELRAGGEDDPDLGHYALGFLSPDANGRRRIGYSCHIRFPRDTHWVKWTPDGFSFQFLDGNGKSFFDYNIYLDKYSIFCDENIRFLESYVNDFAKFKEKFQNVLNDVMKAEQERKFRL